MYIGAHLQKQGAEQTQKSGEVAPVMVVLKRSGQELQPKFPAVDLNVPKGQAI